MRLKSMAVVWAGALALGAGAGAVAHDPAPSPGPAVQATATRTSALLVAARGGDGDSWKDSQGREYRMGLVNTPEFNECYGSQATAKRKALVADGFSAAVYETDAYGRRVSVISLADGTNLNVWMARHGYANDKYLATFRHENPELASQLDPAFAAARSEGAGLWGACSGRSTGAAARASTPTPEPR